MTREFKVLDVEGKPSVYREFIKLGDATIRLSQSEDVSSIQVTKGESTAGIVFNAIMVFHQIEYPTEYHMPVASPGTLITVSITYDNSKNIISKRNPYSIGSIEPLSWECFGDPSDTFGTDLEDYYCYPEY
ncbi:MAG: hypothetical protein NTZ48_00420 [Candidatus Omnitrophica bacterium]|nr:hypothetical protein [Candidatus Omnitrophota bacterium]